MGFFSFKKVVSSVFPAESMTFAQRDITEKTYLRITEIYSQYVASRQYHYENADGLHHLLKSGLSQKLKKLIDKASSSGCAYLLLHFDDTADNLSQPPKDFRLWELGDIVESLNQPLHADRYVKVCDWKSSQEREALKSVCRLFDRAVELLGDGLSASLKPTLTLGDLHSLREIRSLTSREKEEIKTLLEQVSTSRLTIIGKNDSFSQSSLSSSSGSLFSYLAGYLSFLSGLPLTFFLPQEKEELFSKELFFREIENISQLVIQPLIEDLLKKLNLQSNWRFQEMETLNEKEKAEIALKKAQALQISIETLQSLKPFSEKEIESITKECFSQVISSLRSQL